MQGRAPAEYACGEDQKGGCGLTACIISMKHMQSHRRATQLAASVRCLDVERDLREDPILEAVEDHKGMHEDSLRQQQADEREARVEEIKAQVGAKAYLIDITAIANSMLQDPHACHPPGIRGCQP